METRPYCIQAESKVILDVVIRNTTLALLLYNSGIADSVVQESTWKTQ